jgi:MFS family permease
MSAGYLLGGALGDAFFKRTSRGRMMVGAAGVLTGAAFLFATLNVAFGNAVLFVVLLAFTGLTMSIAAPNVMATVHDTTVPEARSTARSLHKLVEDGGAALAPYLAGVIAMRASLHTAILSICIVAWIVCAALFAVTAFVVPADVQRLRERMQRRAREARQHAA